MWPDCSPPMRQPVFFTFSRTYLVAYRSSLRLLCRAPLRAVWNPILLITVTVTESFARRPSSFMSLAHTLMTLSPSTAFPVSSTADEPARIAIECQARYLRVLLSTASPRASGCVEPHLSFIFIPSGLSAITFTSAPSSVDTSSAATYDAPFAQSRTSFMPLRVSVKC